MFEELAEPQAGVAIFKRPKSPRRASLANKKARVVPEPLAVTRSLSCRFLFERCGVRPAGEEIRQIEAVTNAE